MRSDRKQAEEWARTLELRIKAASAYLDTTRRREAQVCQEGQLRVEAVACLPPLILESLLRGYHSVGFLQQAPAHAQDSSSGLVGDAGDSSAQPDSVEKDRPRFFWGVLMKYRGYEICHYDESHPACLQLVLGDPTQ